MAAENDLRTKRIALDQLVGRAMASHPRPLVVPATLPPVVPAEPEAWVGPPTAAPAGAQARVGLDVAQLETEKARAAEVADGRRRGSRWRVDASGSSVRRCRRDRRPASACS
jgi:outer membrane protein